jgi:serine/threonine protein phosphatase PrpC
MLTTQPVLFNTAVATDPGRHRSQNEDACVALPHKGMFILADGMGGHPAGATAAVYIVHHFPYLLDLQMERRFAGGRTISHKEVQQAIRQAAVELNYQLYNQGCQQAETFGMGSTVVLAWLFGRQAHLMNLGDSRIYLWREGNLRQLTEDHNVGNLLLRQNQVTADEIEGNPLLRRLARCVGMPGAADPDLSTLLLEAGDRLLLCSDGLTTMLADEEIAIILSEEPDLDAACQTLIAAANVAGGRDNISVILVGVP